MKLFLLFVTLAAVGCSDSPAEPDLTSETHWMQTCSDGDPCNGGTCLCGVCTLPCTAPEDCAAAGPLTTCVPAGAAASELVCGRALEASVSLCLAPCDGVDACSGVGEDLSCDADHCVPPPADPRACTDNADCSPGFCRKPSGTCLEPEAAGVCAARPNACTEIFAPVCGCDGVTYDNGCFAEGAGVNVASDAACEEPPAQCVGQDECPENSYCHFPVQDTCGLLLEFPGVCEPRPEACDADFTPVCGCDGETYSNACVAAGAGQNVASQGECALPPTECGGFRGLECEPEFYCHYEPDLMCGAGDQIGVCMPVPEVCTDEVAPVCACDSNTYSNACEAHALGLSVLREGACE